MSLKSPKRQENIRARKGIKIQHNGSYKSLNSKTVKGTPLSSVLGK